MYACVCVCMYIILCVAMCVREEDSYPLYYVKTSVLHVSEVG